MSRRVTGEGKVTMATALLSQPPSSSNVSIFRKQSKSFLNRKLWPCSVKFIPNCCNSSIPILGNRFGTRESMEITQLGKRELILFGLSSSVSMLLPSSAMVASDKELKMELLVDEMKLQGRKNLYSNEMELIPGLPEEIGRECLIRATYKEFHVMLAVSKRWKQEIESEDFHRERKKLGLNRSIFVFTQSDPTPPVGDVKYPKTPAYRLKLHDLVTGDWDILPPIPGYAGGLPLFCQCAGVGRKLLVIGGWNLTTWDVSNSVYIYDFLSARWKRGKNMPGVSRSFFSCAADHDRMVFIAGGHDEEKNALRSALVYDVIKDEWTPLPDMANQRDESKGLFHAGKFHVIGGYHTEMQGRFEKTAEAFDVDTWQWGQKEDDMLEVDTCPRTCVFDCEGNLYRCLAAQLARKVGDTWETVSELPMDVRVGPCLATWQNKTLVIGSDVNGGPHRCYELELNEKYTWRKVETPKEFTGHVQAGCSLNI